MTDIQINPANYALLRRLDHDGDGTITKQETVEAVTHSGPTRIQNEAAGLAPQERSQLVSLLNSPHGEPIQVTFGQRRIGQAAGRMSWQDTHVQVTAGAAGTSAPLGTVGQERVGALDNSDCGPTSALFINDRRIARATGHAPVRTQASADALISGMSRGEGTTAFQMSVIMNRHFGHAGRMRYEHQSHDFTQDTLAASLMQGLASDPGGVMVPVVSTYNADQTTGTRHWIVVTAWDGNKVQYYDPGGPDGANHLHHMPMAELQASLETNPLWPLQMVYGTATPEAQVAGQLPVGRQIGQVDVRLANRDLTVQGARGVYGAEASAHEVARQVAAENGHDAVVVREGQAFAVYAINEVRDQFGGLWSNNTLTNLDSHVATVYMTDPTTHEIRRARSGP